MPTITRVKQARPDHKLLPWSEVARRFTERSGQRMSPKLAEITGARALAKLRKALDAQGIESPDEVAA